MLEETLIKFTDNLKWMKRPYSQQESFSRSILHIGCFPSSVKSFRSMLWHISVGFSELQRTSWGFFLQRWCCSIPIRPRAGSVFLLFLCVGTHRPGSWRICGGFSSITCSVCTERASDHVAALHCRVQVSPWVRLARTCLGACCCFWRGLD